MTLEELLNELVNCQSPITFTTTPARAFMLVAQLQLALRHPENKGETARVAREFITHLGNAIAETTQLEETLQVIAAGSHPEWDIKTTTTGDREILDVVACHVLAARWLASYISVTEGVSSDSILERAREKAWERWQKASPDELAELLDMELKTWETTSSQPPDPPPDPMTAPANDD